VDTLSVSLFYCSLLLCSDDDDDVKVKAHLIQQLFMR